jgi:hypothetical protein
VYTRSRCITSRPTRPPMKRRWPAGRRRCR